MPRLPDALGALDPNGFLPADAAAQAGPGSAPEPAQSYDAISSVLAGASSLYARFGQGGPPKLTDGAAASDNGAFTAFYPYLVTKSLPQLQQTPANIPTQSASADTSDLVAATNGNPAAAAFIAAHLPDALLLADLMGNGVTAEQILSVAGDETEWGTSTLAQNGNLFGLHQGNEPFPGQTGIYWTQPPDPKGSVPTPTFNPSAGFFLSGLAFVANVRPPLSYVDASDPETFFRVIHENGYASEMSSDGYYTKMMVAPAGGIYSTVKRNMP